MFLDKGGRTAFVEEGLDYLGLHGSDLERS